MGRTHHLSLAIFRMIPPELETVKIITEKSNDLAVDIQIETQSTRMGLR